ncbi:MAG: ThuA domain-containing protein [Planctomycetes bacterium]|nr:ThuA domain-containing protein [Planctomycetota bacterium]
MHRREMLAASSAAVMGLSAFPFGWTSAAEKKKQKLLYFTRSVEYEHSVVGPGEDGLSHSDKVLVELGKEVGFEVECTKDGRVFDGDLDRYDAVVFYSCGDLFLPSVRKAPPMSPEGRKRLLAAVAAGKPFVALHSACYWGRDAAPDDPYLAMVGCKFVSHGAQQEGTMKVVSPSFPGAKGIGDSFRLMDEWYAMKDFADDLHVVLVQETEGMKGPMYQRPPFPATWARMHGKGRVFFCSMGHREDVWTNKTFQQVLLGGTAWAMGNVDADITPNIKTVTPKSEQLQS